MSRSSALGGDHGARSDWPRARRAAAVAAVVGGLALAQTASAAELAPAGAPEAGAGATGTPPAAEPGATPGVDGAKRRAEQWWTAGFDPGPTQNCINQYYEPLGSTWAGWYGDPGVSPQTNQIYYVMAGWGVSGFPCGGGAYVHLEFVLPANTTLAINGQNPVECYYDPPDRSGQPPTPYARFTNDCPQQAQASTYGGYSFDPPGEAAWPTATGSLYEIYVPVKTSRAMGGPAPPDGQPCNNCLYAGLWMIDGVNSPWAWPKVPVAVAAGNTSSSGPYINYPAPSTVPYNPETGPPPTQFQYNGTGTRVTAFLRGFLYSEGTTGTAQYEFGARQGDYTRTGDPVAIPNGNWLVYDNGESTGGGTGFSFTPGKTYHFRLCYKPTGSNRFCGADQTFHAPPDTGISSVQVKRAQRKAIVYFDAPPETVAGSFQCRLDSGRYKACASPKTFSNLARGGHTVSVRTLDSFGNPDRSPAKIDFKI